MCLEQLGKVLCPFNPLKGVPIERTQNPLFRVQEYRQDLVI